MPKISFKKDKTIVKLTVTVSVEESQPYLEEAAKQLSNNTKIPGFRPGKAGFDVVKKRLGEMPIYEAALEQIVRKTYVKALIENDLDTVGSPKVDVEKLVPGNSIIYTAEVSLMPQIIELADASKIEVKSKKIKVTEKDVDLTLNNLLRMQTKEVRAKATDTATENDKVVIAVDMKKEGVSVEGGQSPNHAVFLSEEYYIPGFKEKILGMKEGDKKEFKLEFPKEHSNKMLAGQEILFEVNLKEVFHLEAPKLDDSFAASLGQKDMKALRELLKKNIENEKGEEAKSLEEREMLESFAKKTQFEDIPDLILNQEVNKMLAELKRGVEEQGLEFDTYLLNLKKTLVQIKLDFTPQALTRIKVSLILREIAKKEKIEPVAKEVEAAIAQSAAQYPDNKEAQAHFLSPNYREYVESIQTNRLVIEHLRSKSSSK